jgi:hypothetical protein
MGYGIFIPVSHLVNAIKPGTIPASKLKSTSSTFQQIETINAALEGRDSWPTFRLLIFSQRKPARRHDMPRRQDALLGGSTTAISLPGNMISEERNRASSKHGVERRSCLFHSNWAPTMLKDS